MYVSAPVEKGLMGGIGGRGQNYPLFNLFCPKGTTNFRESRKLYTPHVKSVVALFKTNL